jgi:FlaA1/EpsC-like NDP-sugar epimerase
MSATPCEPEPLSTPVFPWLPPRSRRVATWLGTLLVAWHHPLVHLVLMVIGYRLAYELRFDFDTPPGYVDIFWMSLPLLVAIRLSIYAAAGVFRVHWHHFGLQDLFALAQATTLSTIAFVLALAVAGLYPGVPRSVILLDWAAAIFAGAGIPGLLRSRREIQAPFHTPCGRRTLVVGAGRRAELLIREARRESRCALQVVGLVDLDGTQGGWTVGGVRVVGTIDQLPAIAQLLRADFVIIALEQPDTTSMRRVVDQCIAAGLEFKTLPSLHEVLEGTPGVNQLRNVNLEDLLGRQPVKLDLSLVRADLQERVILLTGAAGSIGSELARQIADVGPGRLVLVDQAESELYFVHLELAQAHPELDLVPVICDITNADRLGQVFAQWRPDYVFHAAAYKHVPLMETNVVEAVRNNVVGTLLVASAAARHGVKKLLLISTDKAINPSSVMGATKRIAERIIFGLPALRRSGVDFRAVRFGNVLASNGSVVPLFERQLAAGGPLTVTHPHVQRYLMTIPEAVQLVLQAGSLPETAGSIAMLEMGEPVRILDLAEKLIRFSGRVPGRDVRIVFTGLRPGEKLTEDLVSAIEAAVPTSAEKIRISQTVESGDPTLEQMLGRLFTLVDLGDREGLLATICDLVPECVPPLSHAARARGFTATLIQATGPTNGSRAPGERPSPDVGFRLVERRDRRSCRRLGDRRNGRSGGGSDRWSLLLAEPPGQDGGLEAEALMTEGTLGEQPLGRT